MRISVPRVVGMTTVPPTGFGAFPRRRTQYSDGHCEFVCLTPGQIELERQLEAAKPRLARTVPDRTLAAVRGGGAMSALLLRAL